MDKANDNQAPEQGSIQEPATNVETTAIPEDSNMPPYKQTDIAYAFIMPVIGFLFVRYVFFLSSLGAAVFTVIFFAAVTIWMRGCGCKMALPEYICLTVGLALGGVLYYSDNYDIRVNALFLLMILVIYYITSVAGARIAARLGHFLPLEMLYAAFVTPFVSFVMLPRVLTSNARRSGNFSNVLFSLLGTVLAVPVLLRLALTLVSADAAFESAFQEFYWRVMETYPIRCFQLVISIPVTLYLYGLVFGSMRRDKPRLTPERADELLERTRVLPPTLTLGFITPIVLLYLVFCFTQRAYFFSAFNSELPTGFSYAEYARRGFFELCGVSAFNICMVLVLMYLTRHGEGLRVFKVYSLVFCLLSIVFVAIALSKMFMYIQNYGLTPKRLYTSVFMIFLTGCFLLLIITVFRRGEKGFESDGLIRGAVLLGITLFLLLCCVNPSALIARVNYDKYKNEEIYPLDVELLLQLDSGATPVILEIWDDVMNDRVFLRASDWRKVDTRVTNWMHTYRQLYEPQGDDETYRYGYTNHWEEVNYSHSHQWKVIGVLAARAMRY